MTASLSQVLSGLMVIPWNGGHGSFGVVNLNTDNALTVILAGSDVPGETIVLANYGDSLSIDPVTLSTLSVSAASYPATCSYILSALVDLTASAMITAGSQTAPGTSTLEVLEPSISTGSNVDLYDLPGATLAIIQWGFSVVVRGSTIGAVEGHWQIVLQNQTKGTSVTLAGGIVEEGVSANRQSVYAIPLSITNLIIEEPGWRSGDGYNLGLLVTDVVGVGTYDATFDMLYHL